MFGFVSAAAGPSRYCEAFAWGSRSTSRVRSPFAAATAARFTAIVDLPTPPFWLNTTKRIGASPATESRVLAMLPPGPRPARTRMWPSTPGKP